MLHAVHCNEDKPAVSALGLIISYTLSKSALCNIFREFIAAS